MKIPIIHLYHARKKRAGIGHHDYRRITDFYDLSVKMDSDKTKDTFSFKIANNRTYENGTFNFSEIEDFSKRDMIKIYAFYEDEYSEPSAENLLIVGYIKKVNYSVNESSSEFDISGHSVSETLMNILVPAIFSGGNEAPVDDIIISLVNKANGTASNKQVNASKAILDSDGNRVGGGYIWPNKLDGSPFPVISYHKNYSNIYDHLDDLAGMEYTGDKKSGAYIYYLDKDRNVHFEPKFSEVKFTLDEYEIDYSLLEKGSTTDGMVNVILFNCGIDPNGNGIIIPVYNLRSVKKYGSKWKYHAEDRIAQNIMDTEARLGPVKNPGKEIGPTNYPIEAGSPNVGGYPWTVSLNGVWSDREYYAGVTQVNDNDEYKNYIRDTAKFIGYKHGRDIVDIKGFPRAEVKYEPEIGTHDYLPNDVIDINFRSLNFNRKLRVTSIEHDFSSGWNTSITLKEDEDTAAKSE